MLLVASATSAQTGSGKSGVWSGSVNFAGGSGFKDYDSESKFRYSNFLGEGSASIGWKGTLMMDMSAFQAYVLRRYYLNPTNRGRPDNSQFCK